jgi:hypothetical protein
MEEKKLGRPPKMSNNMNEELTKLDQQFQEFDQKVKDVTLDSMNKAPLKEVEPQTKLSQKELEKSKDIYLKPRRTIGCSRNDKFNEKYRDQYNFQKEYVHFIAENKEIKGETIEMWTRPFPGLPAEEWVVPTNKPLWAPRYVAEQITRRKYHRLKMDEQTTPDNFASNDSYGKYYGQVFVDHTIERFSATPVSNRKSIFMGVTEFK